MDVNTYFSYAKRVKEKDATTLLSLYLCVAGALLRPKFYMTHKNIGIYSSAH